jgi:hypothetical protein
VRPGEPHLRRWCGPQGLWIVVVGRAGLVSSTGSSSSGGRRACVATSSLLYDSLPRPRASCCCRRRLRRCAVGACGVVGTGGTVRSVRQAPPEMGRSGDGHLRRGRWRLRELVERRGACGAWVLSLKAWRRWSGGAGGPSGWTGDARAWRLVVRLERTGISGDG